MRPRSRHAAPTRWTGAAGNHQHARLHRESDARRLRAMATSLAGAGLLVALVLALVGLKVQQVRLSYRLDSLRAARAQFEETQSRLRVELATLKSLARIDGKARGELGMVAPRPDQVRLAREFVQGDGGRSAARAPLTASVDPADVRPAPRESR